MGNGPKAQTKINPNSGACPKPTSTTSNRALARATARERAEKIISNMVVKGADVTEDEADKIYQREVRRVSRKLPT